MCENDPRNHPPFAENDHEWETYISGRPGVIDQIRNHALLADAWRRLQEGRD